MLGEHLLGIYEKAFDPDASWAYRAQTAGELGFDFIELSIDEQDSRIERLYWPTVRKRELAGICSDRGTPLMVDVPERASKVPVRQRGRRASGQKHGHPEAGSGVCR